jgi:stress response protein YsnF
VETSRTRIKSRIIERPVEAKLDVREEHVNVERTPVDRPVSSEDSNLFKEGEIEIREFAEVPIVKKEARIVEEVSLNKEVKEKEETIRETLRSTEVDTERIKREIKGL